MTDLRTTFVPFGGDLVQSAAGLETDEGLETAVAISLFTDRRADPDDVLPDNSANHRGWWGDSFADIEGDRIGSRLWLLHREKQRPVVLERAREYAREALRWLIDDGIARSVEVVAEFTSAGLLGLGISIARADAGPVRFRFETFWGGENGV